MQHGLLGRSFDSRALAEAAAAEAAADAREAETLRRVEASIAAGGG